MALPLHNTVIIPFHTADFNAIRMDFGGSMQKQTLPQRRNVCLSNKLRRARVLLNSRYDLSALSHLRHVLLQPVQDSLFKSGDIALADAHDIRHLLLRLFRAAGQPEAQARNARPYGHGATYCLDGK